MIHDASLKQHVSFQIQLLKRAVSKFKRKSLAGVQSVRESPERGDGERRNTSGKCSINCSHNLSMILSGTFHYYR